MNEWQLKWCNPSGRRGPHSRSFSPKGGDSRHKPRLSGSINVWETTCSNTKRKQAEYSEVVGKIFSSLPSGEATRLQTSKAAMGFFSVKLYLIFCWRWFVLLTGRPPGTCDVSIIWRTSSKSPIIVQGFRFKRKRALLTKSPTENPLEGSIQNPHKQGPPWIRLHIMRFFSGPYGVLITTPFFWLKGVHLQPARTPFKGFTSTQGVPPKTLLCFKCFSESQRGWFTGSSFVLRVPFRSHTRDPLRTLEIKERWTFRTAGAPLTSRTIKKPSSKIWGGPSPRMSGSCNKLKSGGVFLIFFAGFWCIFSPLLSDLQQEGRW